MPQRFQETVNIGGVDTRTGAAGGLLSLSNRLESFKQQQLQISGQRAIERGIKSAGERELEKDDQGVTVAPETKKQRFIGGIEINAHNKALRAAYLASLDNDIRENVARIHAENPDNLAKFNEAVEGFSNGVLQGVDPAVRQDVSNSINQRIGTARINVQAENIKKDNELAFEELKFDADNALDSALVFSRNGEMLSAANELVNYSLNIDRQFEGNFISEKEGVKLKREAELAATQESLVGTVRRFMDIGKHEDVLKGIEKTRSKTPAGMTLDEQDEIVSAMIAEVNEAINIKTKLEDVEADSVVDEQQAAFNDSFLGVVEGTTSATEIKRQFKNQKISQTQFNTLISAIGTRGFGVDDWQLIGSIQEDIRNGLNPDEIRNKIISNDGTRLTNKTSTLLISDLNVSLDKESPLNTNEVKRARNFIIPSIRVTGPLGALDTEAERRLATAIREYDTRVLSGENPWLIADELVGKDSFERASNPMFGEKTDLDGAQEKLDLAFDSESIDDETYNFETNKINTLKQLKSNIEEFEKSKKENLNAP